LNYGFQEGADNFNLGQADLANPTQGFTQWVQWVRATRAWGADVNNNGKYDQTERNPRFVFGDYVVIESGDSDSETETTNWVYSGNKYQFLKDSDDDIPNQIGSRWFSRKYINMAGVEVEHQPTFFNMKGARLPGIPFIQDYPDKGWYSQQSSTAGTVPSPRLNFPFQMLHKNNDFEQLGEIYNVMLFGHRLRAPTVNGNITYQMTEVTFSEAMSDEANYIPLVGQDARVNRFRMLPSDTEPPIAVNPTTSTVTAGYVLGVGDQNNPRDPRHAIPNLPAAARLMDLFVLDGPGLNGTAGVDDLRLAGGFTGRGTPGLINLTTAPVEVMRALPNWYRLVHETGGPNDDPDANVGNEYRTPADQPLVTNSTVPNAILPRVMLPEALEAYRERLNGEAVTDPNPTGIPGGPNYELRTKLYPGPADTQHIRGERGIASIGELFALKEPADSKIDRPTVPGDPAQPIDEIFQQFWKIDLGATYGAPNSANKPFSDAFGEQVSLRVSTDTVGEYDLLNPTIPRDDRIAGDAEEANMLFNGVSNLVTTRSDTFTVYFRVRSFRQDTSKNPAVWDATNPDTIIDDSRYVMLVDRTNVNSPADKPRILYFEKLPN
jgi:hypothetical protein